MRIDGAGQQRGHVLLVAGDTARRRRTVQIEPSANLAALLLLPVPALLGSDLPTDTTYLDGVRDQNALLVKLRTAAATPGPLLVYLSGRLTVDRRSHQLCFALAGTTAATARYTALPWEWLGTELRHRPAGLTTVLIDLAADKAAWPLLREYGAMPAPDSVEVYGTVAPPGFPGPDDGHVSTYTRAWIEQLRRSPRRPADSRLHALAVGAAALPPGAFVVPSAPQLAAPGVGQRHASPLVTPAQPPVASTPPQDRASGGDESRRIPEPSAEPSRPHPRPTPGVPPAVPETAGRAPVPVRQPGPAQGAPAAPDEQDPRPWLHALARQRRFVEAARLAQVWETHILQTFGTDSPQATHWVEIRADLAKEEGNLVLATQLWISAGRTRLAHQAPDDPEVLTTARSAHYCWTKIADPVRARECGPDLIALLSALPALDPRHLLTARHRLEHLRDVPPAGAGGRSPAATRHDEA
ncbi:hypothetical protein [uncultured Streptomyces sp.]|uniref:hypothetical protein n=1 Tax=uncultured Streptomyces sp. TaxID=174707 RepID=UPI00262F22B4|nr:hypothetical protein [uncultured Streptomyces sp.]